MAKDHRKCYKIYHQSCCRLISVCTAMVFLLHIVQAMDMGCGIVVDSNIPMILNGEHVRRGAWPFVAALFRKPNQFKCGGTVLSRKHVLTAAHCVELKGSPTVYRPEEIAVRLGTHNIAAQIEEGAVNRNVSEIHVHPDWDQYDEHYDADIAVLVLSVQVDFTLYVQPICLPPDDFTVDDVEGHIVGWGYSENGKAQEIARETVTKALNDSYCYRAKYVVAMISTSRTFCAGNGTGVPSTGDSGGGIFAVSHSRWVQFGVISAMTANVTGHITPDSYALFTNVKLFRDWIVGIVDWQIVDCIFEYLGGMYACLLLKTKPANYLFHINGSPHQQGKTNDDVATIHISNFTTFLSGIKIRNNFQHLRKLEVVDKTHYDVSFRISSTHFADMESLVKLTFILRNEKNFVVDFLSSLLKLEKFSVYFAGNGQIVLDGTTFKASCKINEIFLGSPHHVSVPWNLLENNFLLETVGFKFPTSAIDGRTFDTNENLRKFFMESMTLTVLPWDLFRNNILLDVIYFHSMITAIDRRTFETNEKLRIITLKALEVTAVPWNLLKNNSLLENVTLDLAITEIDGRIFGTNEKLTNVALLLLQLKALPWNVFQNNSLLEKVGVDSQIREMDGRTFQANEKLREVFLKSWLLKIVPWNLFRHNFLLEKLTLSFLATEVDERIFETNQNLTEIELNTVSLRVLPWNLLKNNLRLERVHLFDLNLTEIDARTFETNVLLREVSIELFSLHDLPKNLFKNNLRLEKVEIDGSLNTINEDLFETNVKLKAVNLALNSLEFLPKDLFKNNFLLEVIDFRRNNLRKIDAEFGALLNLQLLELRGNYCINERFDLDNEFYSLINVQRLIRSKCTPPTPPVELSDDDIDPSE